ncbi:MAG: metal ABC transporter permease [Parachlamydiaceae bacterium]
MDSQHYFNPYSNQTFFGFFIQLITRFWSWINGGISSENIASDEVQIFVLAGVAASSALVGTFLVLRKMTMLANSLSHTILIGIVLAFLWAYGLSAEGHAHSDPIDVHVLIIAALIMGFITTILTELLTRGARLQEDASTGIVFTSLFAVGIVAVTLLTRNVHIGTEAVMGNVDALQIGDCLMVYTVLAVNLLLFIVFFKGFNITTFDPGLSKIFGISPVVFSYLLMMQVSLTSISAYRAVGVLMLLAFVTGPALTARMLTSSLRGMLALSAILGISASLVGVALTRDILTRYDIALSTSGVVVCVIVLFYIATAVIITFKGEGLFGKNKINGLPSAL